MLSFILFWIYDSLLFPSSRKFLKGISANLVFYIFDSDWPSWIYMYKKWALNRITKMYQINWKVKLPHPKVFVSIAKTVYGMEKPLGLNPPANQTRERKDTKKQNKIWLALGLDFHSNFLHSLLSCFDFDFALKTAIIIIVPNLPFWSRHRHPPFSALRRRRPPLIMPHK